ncbi:MAG: hypothetical protein C4346_16125, partial [Chloroflexota bacterium]
MGLEWDGGSARLGRGDLVHALVIEPDPGADEPFSFRIDQHVVAELLSPIAGQIAVPAQDARFRLVNNRVKVVQREVVGRELDVEAAAA